MKGSIKWWCITRNHTTLVSAGEEEGEVSKIAKKLIKKRQTAGYEYCAQRSKLKGIKFHVYEKDERFNDIVTWVYACVYDTTTEQAKNFLEMLYLIQQDEENNWLWRRGETPQEQELFAKWMLQRVEESFHRAKVTMLEQKVDSMKDQMGRNIDLLLEREEKLEDLVEKAKNAEEQCLVFKKRANELRNKARRAQMWQNAKYGFAAGTAITIVVGVPVALAL